MKKHRTEKKRAARTYENWAFRSGRPKLYLKGAAAVAAVLFLALFIYCAAVCGLTNPGRDKEALAVGNGDGSGFNMLVILRGDDDTVSALMLFRCGGQQKGITVMPVPSGLADGDGQTVCSKATQGPLSADSACESALKINIPYYFELDRTSLRKVLALYGGGFTCPVARDVVCKSQDGRTVTVQAGINYVDSEKAFELASSGTQEERCAMQGALMEAFASQKLTGYYMQHAEEIYPKLATAAKTNFSINEFYLRLPLLRGAANNGRVRTITPKGDFGAQDGSPVRLNEESSDAIKRAFG